MPFAQRATSPVAQARLAFVDLRNIYIAFGIVVSISSIFAIGQAAFDWDILPRGLPTHTAGLFFNPTHVGATVAIVITGLVVEKVYWLIPTTLPSLFLSQSRGAYVALAVGLLSHFFRRPLLLLILALALALAYTYHPSASDLRRLHIWHAAWINLTFWGNGFNSFQYLWMKDPECCIQPMYVHNDYLQTIFEFGIWSLAPFALIAWAASRTWASAWPILATFLFLACFSMPLHMPIPAALGALALVSILTETPNA